MSVFQALCIDTSPRAIYSRTTATIKKWSAKRLKAVIVLASAADVDSLIFYTRLTQRTHGRCWTGVDSTLHCLGCWQE